MSCAQIQIETMKESKTVHITFRFSRGTGDVVKGKKRQVEKEICVFTSKLYSIHKKAQFAYILFCQTFCQAIVSHFDLILKYKCNLLQRQ